MNTGCYRCETMKYFLSYCPQAKNRTPPICVCGHYFFAKHHCRLLKMDAVFCRQARSDIETAACAATPHKRVCGWCSLYLTKNHVCPTETNQFPNCGWSGERCETPKMFQNYNDCCAIPNLSDVDIIFSHKGRQFKLHDKISDFMTQR